MSITPDSKDWTWVVDRACPECGFDAASLDAADVPGLIRANAATWASVLLSESVTQRPRPGVWSPLEYACHVRDVHEIFGTRFDQMLRSENPQFANWDQDAAAVHGSYSTQDSSEVARGLAVTAEATAALLAGVEGAQWKRVGQRSDGSVFTVASLSRYYAHDIEHHRWDVHA